MSPMASPSITFQHCADKPRADGTALVRLRAYYVGRSAYMGTGIYIKAKHWNKRTRRVRQSCNLASLFNRRLDDLYARGMAAAFEAASAADVIATLTGGGLSFSGYARGSIEEMKAFRQRMRTEAVMRKVHAALGEPVWWRVLTAGALRKIEKYMREELANSANTVRLDMGRLRALINLAIRDGVVKPGDSPFVRYTMPRREPTKRRRLTIDELLKVADLDLEVGTPQRVARDMFLIATFGGGVRVSDLLLLGAKSINGSRLEYQAQKTSKLHSIELPPRAVAIIAPYRKALHRRMMQAPNTRPNPYLFPVLKSGDDANEESVRRRQATATARLNRLLKKVAALAEIEGFSSHSARHTFASAAWRHGSPQTVQALLGHSSVAQTETYVASMDTEATDALTQAMWRDAGV